MLRIHPSAPKRATVEVAFSRQLCLLSACQKVNLCELQSFSLREHVGIKSVDQRLEFFQGEQLIALYVGLIQQLPHFGKG